MSQERRRFTRISFGGHCTIKKDGASHQATLLDISLKGALVQVTEKTIFEQDKPCDLEIMINDAPHVALHLNVKMVHHQDDRIGMYFIATDIDSLTHLRRLIELNMGDADKTLRELFLWSK